MMLNNAAKHPAALISGLALVIVAGLAEGQTSPVSHPHEEISCNKCHFGSSPENREILLQKRCTSCHGRPHDQGLRTAGFMGRSGKSCSECHQFHLEQTLDTTMRTTVRPDAGLDSAHCKACHHREGSLQSLSDAHQRAAELYHESGNELKRISPSQACLNCHSKSTRSSWLTATGENQLTFHVQASHPFGVPVNPGLGPGSNFIRESLDPRLPLHQDRIECNTCHLLTAGTEDLLYEYDNKYDLCLGCHQVGIEPSPAKSVTRQITASR